MCLTNALLLQNTSPKTAAARSARRSSSSSAEAWLTDLVNGDSFTGSSSRPAAVAGYPSITVPAGTLHGLPIGISFFAGAYSEPTLLGIAYAFEQATKRSAKPRFLPTLDLGG